MPLRQGQPVVETYPLPVRIVMYAEDEGDVKTRPLGDVLLFQPKVVEINKASKEGELYPACGSGAGDGSTLGTKSEPPAEEGFLPASQVYSVSTGGCCTEPLPGLPRLLPGGSG